jgi:hypothetical protein
MWLLLTNQFIFIQENQAVKSVFIDDYEFVASSFIPPPPIGTGIILVTDGK